MKYPEIKYMSLTIALNYVQYYVYYASGRRICRFVSCCASDLMLYPMDFLRMNRSFRHITYQLSTHGVIPKSIHSWILSVHPQAVYRDNEFDSDIFTITAADSDFRLTVGEPFDY